MISTTEGFDEEFFFCFREFVQATKRGEITGDGGYRKAREGNERQPRIAGPFAREQDDGADATDEDLNAEGGPDGDAGVALTAHFSNFHFFRKAERGPIRDGELPTDGKESGGQG